MKISRKTYRIAQNFSGRKLWQIWRFIANPPKFYPPKSREVSWTLILNGLCLCELPKFSPPIFLQFQLRQSFLPPKFCAIQYSVKHSERLRHKTNSWQEPCCDAMLCSSFTLSGNQNQIWCWPSAVWSFNLHLFCLSICWFNCLGWHKITQTTGRLRQSLVLYDCGCTVEVL